MTGTGDAPTTPDDLDETAAPAGDGEQPATGVAAADEAADRLAQIADAPLEEHVEIYEDVHRQLQEGLADLDEQ
jgi:hypothetical protein